MAIEVNTGEQQVQAASPRKAPANLNKLLLFCVNILLIGPMVLRNFSPIGAGAAAVILLLALAVMLWKGAGVPAAAHLPTLFFCDFCLALALHYEGLLDYFDPDFAGEVFANLQALPNIVILIGVGLAAAGVLKGTAGMNGAAGIAVGAGVILQARGAAWGIRYSRPWDLLAPEGRELLLVFLLAALGWIMLSQAAVYARPAWRDRYTWVGVVMLAAVAVLYLTEMDFLAEMLPLLTQRLWTMPSTLLSWGRVALICGVLLGCAAALCAVKGPNIDPVILTGLASAVFCCKVMLEHRCIYRWPLLLPLFFSIFRCVRNEAGGKKTLLLDALPYLGVQTLVYLVAVAALERWLWVNLLIAVIFGVILYEQYDNLRARLNSWYPWALVVAFFVAEAAAWQGNMCFSMEGLYMLAMICAMGILAFLLISYPNPNGLTASPWLRLGVCACVCLLCLASMRTTIRVDMERQEYTAIVSVEAKGDGREIREASYQWYDWLGQEVTEETPLRGPADELEVQGERLTIRAAGSDGVKTCRTYWYPPNVFLKEG